MSLHSCYPQANYKKYLPALKEFKVRSTPRFVVNTVAESEPGKQLRIVEVSKNGLRIQGPLPKRTQFHIQVRVSEDQIAQLSGQIHWMDAETNYFGVEIVKSDTIWSEYINHLEANAVGSAVRLVA